MWFVVLILMVLFLSWVFEVWWLVVMVMLFIIVLLISSGV